jgi:hypothetical protein
MEPIDLRDLYQPTPFTGSIDVDLEDLVEWFEWQGLDLNPPYQRDSVWTPEQRELFMGHMLTGGELLPVVVHRVEDVRGGEMVDGKQRMETMLMWRRGEIAALLPDGRRVKVSDLRTSQRAPGARVRVAGLRRVTFTVKYVNLPFEERKRFYVRFNSAGTPHTKEELERALAAKERT